MKYATRFFLLIPLLLMAWIPVAAIEAPPEFQYSIPAQQWFFNYPTDVAMDSAGNVYVMDTGNNRVQKFDAAGTYLSQWGSPGSGNGQFSYPSGIAVDSAGNVYVTDTGNHRVQKFDTAGTYLSQWGSFGSGNGQFSYPYGIAVDSAGNVYVTDTGNHRVQKFDAAGTYLSQWGSWGSGNGQFNYPQGIAVDSAGNVYIMDPYNHRVQRFDAAGTYLSQWGSWGSGNGQFNQPRGIAVDSAGNVYVMDTGNNRVQKFDAAGTYLSQWGSPGSGNGQFNYPQGIAVDSAGKVYVMDTYNHRVQKFDTAGTYLSQWGSPGSGNGQFYYPRGIAVDSAGSVYVMDTGNSRVQKFDVAGTYLSQWGSPGSGNGQFNYPQGIAVDSAGKVYVMDTGNHRVQKFAYPRPMIANIFIKKAEVEWNEHSDESGYKAGLTEVKLKGSITLPAGTSPADIMPKATIGLDLVDLDGTHLLDEAVVFATATSEKWTYKNQPVIPGVEKFKIAWKGAEFKYKHATGLELESESIGSDGTSLAVETKGHAMSMTVCGETIVVDASGAVTTATLFDADDDGEITFELTCELTPDKQIFLTVDSDPQETIDVVDYYLLGSGKFELEAEVDSTGYSGSSTPVELGLYIGLGELGMSGEVTITSTDWTNITAKEWKLKKTH